MSKNDFAAMYAKQQFHIDYVPIDSRERISRWGGHRANSVSYRDFTVEEIDVIVILLTFFQIYFYTIHQ